MDKQKIIVANTGDDSLSVIELHKGFKSEVLSLCPLLNRKDTVIMSSKKSFLGPHQVITGEEKNIVYTTNAYDSSIFKINIKSRRIEEVAVVGKYPSHMQIVDNLIFVTNSDSNSTSIIDKKDFNLIENIPVGEKPHDIKYDKRNNNIFIANSNGYSITKLDLNTSKSSTMKLNYNPQHLYIEDRKMYIVCPQSNGMARSNVSVMDLDTMEVYNLVDICGVILEIALIKEKDIVFITNGENGYLYKVSLKDNSIIKKYYLGGMPNSIVRNQDYLFITDSLRNHVIIFDFNKDTIVKTIGVGLEPNGMDFI